MSIRFYLFMLFGLLITALGLSQLLLMNYVKTELQAQLQQSSKTLSQDVIRLAFEQLSDAGQQFITVDVQNHDVQKLGVQNDDVHQHDEPESVQRVREQVEHELQSVEQAFDDIELDIIFMDQEELAAEDAERARLQAKIEALSEQYVRLSTQSDRKFDEVQRQQDLVQLNQQINEYISQLVEQQTQQKSQQLQQQQQALVTKQVLIQKDAVAAYEARVKQLVDNLDIDTDNWLNEGQVVIKHFDDGTVINSRQFNVPSNESKHTLEKFSESLIWMVIISCLLTLCIAFWLTTRFTRPLSALHQGHTALGKGEFGVTVPEQGVKELQQIMQGFNRMSKQLMHWNEKEQSMAAQQHLADLGQMAKSIAHSLRNPLHTIGLLADQASIQDDQQQRLRLYDKIRQKMMVMDKNIQALLALGNTDIDRQQSINIDTVVQDILLEMKMSPKVAAIQVVQLLDMPIKGSETEIRTILHSVITNAVEASTEHQTIEVTTSESDESYHVTVTDSGVGIENTIKDKLFEAHISSKAEGSGMGLYLAKKIITSHYQGDIAVTDNPQGGTIVELSFKK
ncbi:ATP-binding protein [Shewanella maritima]|uniref:sensor histidine kinase n=1 Tax=Shewanella maritima TaxID=2520507 RepID=UPI0037351448